MHLDSANRLPPVSRHTPRRLLHFLTQRPRSAHTHNHPSQRTIPTALLPPLREQRTGAVYDRLESLGDPRASRRECEPGGEFGEGLERVGGRGCPRVVDGDGEDREPSFGLREEACEEREEWDEVRCNDRAMVSQ